MDLSANPAESAALLKIAGLQPSKSIEKMNPIDEREAVMCGYGGPVSCQSVEQHEEE